MGKYAQAALTKLGAWDAIAPRLVRAENVRAALAYVARGEARLGIVYSTRCPGREAREGGRHLPRKLRTHPFATR